MNKLKLLLATTFIATVMSFTAFAGQWKQDSVGWWYQNDDGSYLVNVLKQIEGPWYYFDNTGYMKTGDFQLSDGWYSFREDGTCSNPISPTTGLLVGAPGIGWVECTDKTVSTLQEIKDGRIVFYNDMYWASPEYVKELKDLAEKNVVTRQPTNTLAPGVIYNFN